MNSGVRTVTLVFLSQNNKERSKPTAHYRSTDIAAALGLCFSAAMWNAKNAITCKEFREKAILKPQIKAVRHLGPVMHSNKIILTVLDLTDLAKAGPVAIPGKKT